MSEQRGQTPDRPRLGRVAAVGAGITAAARCAGQLLVTFLPLAMLCLVAFVALVAAAGDRVVTVNGVVQFPRPSAALIALAIVLAVLGAFVTTGVAVASSFVVAGRLTGTRVDGFTALRRALRAWRPCLAFTVALLGYGALGTLAGLVLGTLWARYPHSSVRFGVVAGLVVLLVLTLYLLRYVLVVPAVVLDDGRRAFTDARRLAANRSSHTLLALLVSAAVPALVFLGVDVLAASLPTVAHTLLTAVAGVVAGWLYVTLFAATTTAICVDRSGTNSAGARAPSRRVPVAVALLFAVLPAVGYGLYPTTGPRSLPVVTDQVLRGLGEDRADFASTLVRGRAVVAYGHSMVWCGDAACRNQHRVPIPGHLIRLSIAPLPDGGVALAGWTPKDLGMHSYRSVTGEKVTDRWWQYRLVVVECRAQGCGDLAHAPVLRRDATNDVYAMHSAVATTPDGRIAVIDGAERDGDKTHPTDQPWQLTVCGDATCATRHTLALTATSTRPYQTEQTARIAAITTTRDGRPVAAVGFPTAGRLVVATCDSATCRHAHEEAMRVPASELVARMSVATTATGRPVLAVPTAGGSRLVLCHDDDCTTRTERSLHIGSPGAGSWPVTAVDRRGRPVVATLDDDRVAIAACVDPACTRSVVRRLTRTELGSAGMLDLMTGATGSPVVVWYSEELPRARGVPHVLGCARGCTG